MGPLPFLAGSLAIYLALRGLARRRKRQFVRLDDGRRLRLLSAVAVLNGSASDLMALEFVPTVRSSDSEAVRHEARSVLQAVGRRAEYAGCRTAVLTAGERVFTFRRGDTGTDWHLVGDSSGQPVHGAWQSDDVLG